ncbi:18S rRNA (guanine-N(7))-methyltransferase RID2 [Linum perenne]
MATRPENLAPPEIFYNDSEARKYTSSSRIIKIQSQLSERALELLALPNDGVPRLLLDIGCGSGLSGETITENGHEWIGLDISESMLDIAVEREVDGDLMLHDMGQGLPFRPGTIDGAISISAVQRELILRAAMQAGFAGGVVVDYPHSTKSRKEYLVLTCGPSSIDTATPRAKGADGEGESCSEDENSDDYDEEKQTVSISDRHRPRKRQKTGKKGKGRQWILKKKDQLRGKGHEVPPDTRYTGRKRKARF